MLNALKAVPSSVTNLITVPQINKSYNIISVGDQKYIGLSVDDFILIDPIKINRNSHLRVNKMKPVFDQQYLDGQISTLTQVAIGIVVEDFTDPNTGEQYKKGEIYILDANTRKYYWMRYPTQAAQTPMLSAKIHFLEKFEDVEASYYSYDNAKSAEKANEILQGLARRYNWTPRQKGFQNGSYTTALKWASYEPGLKNSDFPDVWQQFDLNFNGLKVLDSIPKNGESTITNPKLKPLKSQAILAALLTALRFNQGNLRLFEMIERLATIDVAELDKAISTGSLDPVQIIAAEYTGRSVHRSGTGQPMPQWLNGVAGDTKWSSQKPQMDFLMYWIENYITFGTASQTDFRSGVRPTSWTEFDKDDQGKPIGAWDAYFI